MKIASPLFAVALAGAVLAPGINAQTKTCSTDCSVDSGCTAQTITDAGATFSIPVPTTSICADSTQKTYIKSLTVSEDKGRDLTVTFARATSDVSGTTTSEAFGLEDTTPTNKVCFKTYANVGYSGGASSHVQATVACTDGAAGCSIKYKVIYGCTLTSACSKESENGGTGEIVKGDAGKFQITAPSDPACTTTGLKKYITSLTVSENNGLGIAVAFQQGVANGGAAVVPAAPTKLKDNGDPAYNDCYLAYTDVGKTDALTKDVVATVTCTDKTAACNIKYKASWICRAPTGCSKNSPDGSASQKIAAKTVTIADPSFTIPIPADAPTKCPYNTKRYISSLTVSEDAGLDFAVTFKQGTAAGGTAVATPADAAISTEKDNGDPAATVCFRHYTDVGRTESLPLTDDVIATVKCKDQTAACNIKYKATYSCSTVISACPTDVSGLPSQSVATTAGFPIQKTTPCTGAGQFNYLTSLDVRGPVVITFNNDLTTKPVSTPTTPPLLTGETCSYYKDVMGKKAHATNMVATVKCTGTPPCTINYAATWNCTAPIMYTRTSTDSEKCGKLSDCDNRCAKSYQLIAATTYSSATPPVQTTTMKLKSPPVAGCTCTDIDASTDSTPATGATAKTADTLTTVQVTESSDTLTITSTVPDKECVAAYKRVSFDNKFVAKPYTRTTVDTACKPDPKTAPLEDICAYKCAAEFELTKSQTDMIRATPSPVDGCTCPPIDAYVGDDGISASYATETVKYEFTKVEAVLKVKTTTTSGSNEQVCNAEYKESCSKLCTDGSCGVFDIPTAGLPLTNLDGCPMYTFSYPKSVTVRGLLAESEVSVKSASAVPDAKAVKCYKSYTLPGVTLTSIGADVSPTVQCGTDGCQAAVKTEWGCSTPKCPTGTTGLSPKVTMTVPNATGMVVPGPTTACTTGLKAYIKSLDVRSNKDIVVKFNNGLTPAPSSKGTGTGASATCTFYSNVISPTAATDVTATINCASTTAAETCDVQYKVDYGCFKPAAATVYTRKGAPDGRGCVTDLSTCASRCAKSYQLITTEKEKMLVPQITPDGCYCPALTATTGDDTIPTKNDDTTMVVTETGSALTVEYSAPGKECKTTFAKAAFASGFVAETYARGAVTPATCVPAADADAATTCAYKCTAELSIKPLGVDALNVTQAVVTTPAECTCDPFMVYVDVDGSTASGPVKTSTVEIKQTSGAVTVKTTTGSTVCTATYAKKTAPPPPATTAPTQAPTPQPTTTTKTGTSAGVSALGAGADAGMVTVTLVAAAAGVQAVGLPA